MGYVHSRNGVVGLPEGSGMESGTCVCHRFGRMGRLQCGKGGYAEREGVDGCRMLHVEKTQCTSFIQCCKLGFHVYGAGPELHGYTEWGSRTPELPSRVLNEHGIFPTVFSELRKAAPDAEMGVLYEWDGIKYLVDTLALNHHAQAPDYNTHPTALCDMACEYITQKKPVLSAFCFDNPDHVGHGDGHDTPAYYAKLKELDGYVGRIVDAIKEAGIYENSIIIVTADHGGINKGHGGKTMEEMETPFIIAGKNIKKGGAFEESMMQFDCASTIASVFNLEQPQVWIGRPMTQVFE